MSEGRINLTEICEAAKWDLDAVVARLQENRGQGRGLSREDAEAFAAFNFTAQEGKDAADELNDSQRRRLWAVGFSRWEVYISDEAAAAGRMKMNREGC